MNEHEMRDAYERALRRGDVSRTVDLPFDRLEALVSGEGSEADRLRSIDVLMSTPEGRREFEVAWAAARAAREHGHSSRFSWSRMRMPLVASAALLLIALTTVWWKNQEPSGEELMRGEDSPVQLLTPSGESVSLRDLRFAWRPVAGGRDYVLIVVDTAGGDVFARNTTDTSLTLPDSVQLNPGSEYLWWVQTIMQDGSTLTAVTKRFRITR